MPSKHCIITVPLTVIPPDIGRGGGVFSVLAQITALAKQDAIQLAMDEDAPPLWPARYRIPVEYSLVHVDGNSPAGFRGVVEWPSTRAAMTIPTSQVVFEFLPPSK